jgi:hypothetical protein
VFSEFILGQPPSAGHIGQVAGRLAQLFTRFIPGIAPLARLQGQQTVQILSLAGGSQVYGQVA